MAAREVTLASCV